MTETKANEDQKQTKSKDYFRGLWAEPFTARELARMSGALKDWRALYRRKKAGRRATRARGAA